MKFLGWVHRKFRQNSNEQLKDFSILPSSSWNSSACLTGRASLDEQHYTPKPNCSNRPFGQTQRDPRRKSFPGPEAAQEKDYILEEPSAAIPELFHGFLAIGTLGSDATATDPSTPAFAISVDNITEKETGVTENELKVINDELEKVLVAEAKEDGCNLSSARNSHVSTGRSSHGSTITLSGKPIEGLEAAGNGTTVFPLQEYLLGSAIEMSETTVAKKEHRTSLGELFQRTKSLNENLEKEEKKTEKEEKKTEKDADKSAMHQMKKKLKKKMLNVSSKSSTATVGGAADSAPTETKFHKILHMFHKKVHPENVVDTKKHGKIQKKMKKRNSISGGYNNGDHMAQGENITVYPQRDLLRERMQYRSQSSSFEFTIDNSDSNGNREHWIKTDADYLVLEL